MLFLRQSTVVTVVIGPFLDSTDGVTPETALTISQADVRLSKNAAAFAQKNDATAATHMENGYYSCPLNATDTNTVGRLKLAVNEAGALPVWDDFVVLEEAIYDALFAAAATGALPVSNGGIVAASFAANAITATAIATDAITSAKIATGAITASEIADDAITGAKIADGAINAAAIVDGSLTAAKFGSDYLSIFKNQDRRGTAQAGGATTITLAAGDVQADDFYNGALIILLEGTGTVGLTVAQRTRRIVDYANATNTATVDEAWTTNPASGTRYLIVGG